MITTVTKNNFTDAFQGGQYENSFSYWALNKLFGYLEQYEDDTGEKMELDTCAIARDYSELHYKAIMNNYGVCIEITEKLGMDDVETPRPADDIITDVRDWLESRTNIIAEQNGNFLFTEF